MSDLIKREDAVKMVGILLDKTNDVTDPDERVKLEAYNTGVQGAINMIKYHVPSADRPQGEWIDRSDGGRILHPWWESYECSQCEEQGSGAWNFCPNCGAKMKGADDE